MRSVSFSDGGLRNRDIIFRDETDLYFVSLAVWLRFRHSKLTAGGEGWVRILAIECVIECCWPIFARPVSPFDELERFFFHHLAIQY